MLRRCAQHQPIFSRDQLLGRRSYQMMQGRLAVGVVFYGAITGDFQHSLSTTGTESCDRQRPSLPFVGFYVRLESRGTGTRRQVSRNAFGEFFLTKILPDWQTRLYMDMAPHIYLTSSIQGRQVPLGTHMSATQATDTEYRTETGALVPLKSDQRRQSD